MSEQTASFGLSLRSNFSWTFVGNVVYAGCQWAMLIVLAKFDAPDKVGLFSLGLALTAPVLMFTGLNLRAVQATDAKEQYQFSDYLGLRILATTLALLIIAGIALYAGYSVATALVISAIGVAKAIESMSDAYYGLLQRHERMDYIAKSMVMKGVLSLSVLGVSFYLTHSVLAAAVGLAISWALILVLYDSRMGVLILKRKCSQEHVRFVYQEQVWPRWNWRALFALLWLALPLGFVMMLQSYNTNIPRIFVERYLGQNQLGIFSAIAYLQVVGTTIVGALGQSASPRLADYYAAGNQRAFSVFLLKLVGIGASLGIVGLLIALLGGREILTILYRSEYVEYDLLVRLMVAGGLMYLDAFLGYGITAARFFRIQTPITFLTTMVLAILCLWLIPSQGLRGAANSLIIATCIKVASYLGVTWYVISACRRQHAQEQGT